MSVPTEQPKLSKIEEAALGGGGSETGDVVGVAGFVTSVPSGGAEPTCWRGGGDEPSTWEGGGGDEPFSWEGGSEGANASDVCEDNGEGEGDTGTEGEGEGVVAVWFEFLLVLSARTITNSFSFLRQLSLFPLMK